MKTIIFTIIGIVCATASVFANVDDYSYLKIKLNNSKEINYPPGVSFELKNKDGLVILNLKKLEEIEEFNVRKPLTLFVYTFWNKEPDVYKLKSGTLFLGKSHKSYKEVKKGNKRDIVTLYKDNKLPKDHYNRPTDSNAEKKDNYDSNGVYLTQKKFFTYTKETGYSASIRFSNDVLFYYRNGKVYAWQNGKQVTIRNKYLIETQEGVIKLSYNPQTKKIWWVFDKNE